MQASDKNRREGEPGAVSGIIKGNQVKFLGGKLRHDGLLFVGMKRFRSPFWAETANRSSEPKTGLFFGRKALCCKDFQNPKAFHSRSFSLNFLRR